ncbi:MAG: electron transport complex subunit RsxG [Candidatus Competibacter sp.]|nr:electron transport complex subunit RsxG [Candidatus Competibacteraceae bacterium]
MNWALLKPEYRQRLIYHVVLLGSVALLTSAAIGVADHLTRADIARRQLEDLQVTLQQVVPAAYYDNDLTRDTVSVKDSAGETMTVYRARRGGQVQAVCYQVRAPGYGNTAMVIAIGVDRAGALLGVRVISHSETPGLGDKIELSKSDWILSFTGRSLTDPQPEKWGVKKDGGAFDQFTGATITPRAVVKAVKGGLEFFAAHRALLLDEAPAQTASTTSVPAGEKRL